MSVSEILNDKTNVQKEEEEFAEGYLDDYYFYGDDNEDDANDEDN